MQVLSARKSNDKGKIDNKLIVQRRLILSSIPLFPLPGDCKVPGPGTKRGVYRMEEPIRKVTLTVTAL